jgi:hypothetical protein
MRRAVALLAACALAAVAAGPVLAARTVRLHLGDDVELTGRSGARAGAKHRALGFVFITASWNGHRRYVVATPHTDRDGRFTARFKPSHRGRYAVRILTPDGTLTRVLFLVT